MNTSTKSPYQIRTAQELYDFELGKTSEPKSNEFKQGVMDCLKYRTKESQFPIIQYKEATCQFDAWKAGIEAGHYIYNTELERKRLHDN